MASHRVAIIVRHGERQDDADGSTIPVGDPPLSSRGAALVPELVRKIQLTLDEVEAPVRLADVALYTSPYLRCRETASGLRGAGLGANSELLVDDDISEVYGPVRIKTVDPPSPWQRGSIGQRPNWPETIDDAVARMQLAFKKHISANDDRSFALVTHGDMIDAVLRLMHPKRMTYSVDYLAYLVVRLPAESVAFFKPTDGSATVPVLAEAASGVQWIDDGPPDSPPLPISIPCSLFHPAAPTTTSSSSRPLVAPPRRTQPQETRILIEQRAGASPKTPTAIGMPPNYVPAQVPPVELSRDDADYERQSLSQFLLMKGRCSPRWRTRGKVQLLDAFRLVGIGSQLALLLGRPVEEVITFLGCVVASELTSLHPQLSVLCPTRPWRAPCISRSHQGSDEDAPGRKQSCRALQCLRIPGAAGVLKYVLAVVLFVVIAIVIRSLSASVAFGEDLPLYLVTQPAGLLCVVAYLLGDIIRTFPRSTRCIADAPNDELDSF